MLKEYAKFNINPEARVANVDALRRWEWQLVPPLVVNLIYYKTLTLNG